MLNPTHPNTHANICQFYRHKKCAAAAGRSAFSVSILLAYVGMCIRMSGTANEWDSTKYTCGWTMIFSSIYGIYTYIYIYIYIYQYILYILYIPIYSHIFMSHMGPLGICQFQRPFGVHSIGICLGVPYGT